MGGDRCRAARKRWSSGLVQCLGSSAGRIPPERSAWRLVRLRVASSCFQSLGGGSAISPDGRTVAFVAKVEGVSRLWVRPLDSIKSQELPDTDDAQFPFWSPDGRSLGLFCTRLFEANRRVGRSVDGPDSGSGARGVAAGVRMARSSSAKALGPLQRISASGGTRSSLTTLAAAEVSHRWPRFLPDGRTLFFFVQGDRPGVYLTALDRGGEKQRVADASVDAAYVPPRGTGPGYVLMVQGDSLVAQPFDVDSMRIAGPAVAIPGAGNALTFTGANRSNLSVANDGTIVYAAGSNRYQMTWFGMDGTAARNVGVPDRYVGLRISPDGYRGSHLRRRRSGKSRYLAYGIDAWCSEPGDCRTIGATLGFGLRTASALRSPD